MLHLTGDRLRTPFVAAALAHCLALRALTFGLTERPYHHGSGGGGAGRALRGVPLLSRALPLLSELRLHRCEMDRDALAHLLLRVPALRALQLRACACTDAELAMILELVPDADAVDVDVCDEPEGAGAAARRAHAASDVGFDGTPLGLTPLFAGWLDAEDGSPWRSF